MSYVKKVIHSLVVSSPERMTIERLMRDYRSEEGCNVPYGSLGFRDTESFLRSIPDTVVVGTNFNSIIDKLKKKYITGCGPWAHGQCAGGVHREFCAYSKPGPVPEEEAKQEPQSGEAKAKVFLWLRAIGSVLYKREHPEHEAAAATATAAPAATPAAEAIPAARALHARLLSQLQSAAAQRTAAQACASGLSQYKRPNLRRTAAAGAL